MKYLIDNAISPKVSEMLRANGYDSLHVRELGMDRLPDDLIFEYAAKDGWTVISVDTDFGTLLASRRSRQPSVVLLRRSGNRRPFSQAALLLANLPALEASLADGCVAILTDSRIRIRKLPILE